MGHWQHVFGDHVSLKPLPCSLLPVSLHWTRLINTQSHHHDILTHQQVLSPWSLWLCAEPSEITDQNKSFTVMSGIWSQWWENNHRNIDIILNVLVKISSKWEDNENFGMWAAFVMVFYHSYRKWLIQEWCSHHSYFYLQTQQVIDTTFM